MTVVFIICLIAFILLFIAAIYGCCRASSRADRQSEEYMNRRNYDDK